ncbi:hypothetical protein DICPUDRAFT_147171 [Dictyostelium purpureum]|uniref:Uncharacterized protein n=1 Tax=Dictyostelium purpureum TaxID=5786 RepID=F0Z7U6_DICPU|nr:uncharacterized protein DICPUDRAFT_147171 [Dictyostelium purpureum]EGC40004.1 hypothetical protein DICPUDRAFT_147171 [Dictyostelium purpureum]|eukprot:XP_003283507.1 hypothetical protein DICPUDRAFT_147171 [Dictyostelium purpureum]
MFDLSDFAKMTNSDSEDENENNKNENKEIEQVFEEKTLEIYDKTIKIREFHFSTTNAGYIWPSTYTIIDYILAHKEKFENKKIIELGSATGILSIFLNAKGFDVTSSDYNNPEISENIEYNKSLNNINFRHIPHTWGDTFEENDKNFDIVIASDILLYVMYFEKLMLTLRQLMDNKENSFMLMAYGRKLYDSKKFFVLLEENDFEYELVGSKMWIIKKKKIINK